MANYSIKKISNGEHKEITKSFKLNISKYVRDTSALYFDVQGQEVPFVMDHNLFFNIVSEQIQKGLIEDLKYSNGVLKLTIRDGNVIKNYTWDFCLNDFNMSLQESRVDELTRAIYKLISIYYENPNSTIASEQRYIWLIYDILDGDRTPILDNKEEILRLFEVYNSHKTEFLDTLLDNVVFYDDDGNIIEYRSRLRQKKLDLIRYDVLNQMDIAMLLFAHQNNAVEMHREYLENTFIPRREIVYQETDENGNIIESPQEVEGGTIFSLGREILEQGIDNIGNGIKRVLKRRN